MSVSIVKTKPSYKNINKITDAVKKALDLIEYTPKKDKLVLKPNVGSQHGKIKKGDYVPANFCTAFAEIYKDREIIIAEGAACGMDFEGGMENNGYYKIRDAYPNVTLLNLKEVEERIELEWKYGKMKVPKILLDNEYINIAKFKTHYFSHISMCMKNQKGALTDALKKKFHQIDLQDAIYEMSQVLVPDLNILDGIIGIDGNGPNSMKPIGGRTQKMGLVLASRDICEIDRVAVELTDLDLSKTHVPDIPFEVVGEKLKNVKYPFKKPDLGQQFNMMNFHMQLRSSCSGCMQSFLSCADLMMKRNPFTIKAMKSNLDFFRYGMINPLVLYFGVDCCRLEDEEKKDKSKLVCVGVCTKKLAKEQDLPYIPGCPPTAEEMLAYTLPKKELERDYKIKDKDTGGHA